MEYSYTFFSLWLKPIYHMYDLFFMKWLDKSFHVMPEGHRHYAKWLEILGITWNDWLHRLPVTFTKASLYLTTKPLPEDWLHIFWRCLNVYDDSVFCSRWWLAVSQLMLLKKKTEWEEWHIGRLVLALTEYCSWASWHQLLGASSP